jgi:putative acetyltransferase
MNLRPVQPRDHAAVHRLVAEAFGQEDEARLVEALRRDGDSVIELLADDGGAAIGHALLSRMRAPFAALALAPVSVAPARQRQGVGQAVTRAALALATEAGWAGVFVLGDPGYYARFGFDATAALGFASPYAGTHFMLLALGPALDVRCGEAIHAPAFAALG